MDDWSPFVPSDYTFTGPGFTTQNDPVLYLMRGLTYYFVNNSGGGHPPRLGVLNGLPYNTGTTNNGASTGVITFTVSHECSKYIILSMYCTQ